MVPLIFVVVIEVFRFNTGPYYLGMILAIHFLFAYTEWMHMELMSVTFVCSIHMLRIKCSSA